MKHLTDIELAVLMRLAENAPPAPWHYSERFGTVYSGAPSENRGGILRMKPEQHVFTLEAEGQKTRFRDRLRFMLAAINALPALLAEVRTSRATPGQMSDTHPVAVTLRFKTERAKQFFMSGLSDGFGENECDLEWDAPAPAQGPYVCGAAFAACTDFSVTVRDSCEADDEHGVPYANEDGEVL